MIDGEKSGSQRGQARGEKQGESVMGRLRGKNVEAQDLAEQRPASSEG